MIYHMKRPGELLLRACFVCSVKFILAFPWDNPHLFPGNTIGCAAGGISYNAEKSVVGDRKAIIELLEPPFLALLLPLLPALYLSQFHCRKLFRGYRSNFAQIIHRAKSVYFELPAVVADNMVAFISNDPHLSFAQPFRAPL